MTLLNTKNIKKITTKICKDKYFTYFVAVITLVIISETIRNPEQVLLLGLKKVLNKLIIKLGIILGCLYIGYYNQILGILILLNLFFITNMSEKIEFFVNNLPNLVDKNRILQYEKNYKSPLGDKKPTPTKDIQNEDKDEDKVKAKEKANAKAINTENENNNEVQNHIKLQESEEISSLKNANTLEKEEKEIEKEAKKITKKIDLGELDTTDLETDLDDSPEMKRKKNIYLKYYRKNKKNKKKELDDKGFAERDDASVLNKESLQEHQKRKNKNKKFKEDLIDELKSVETEYQEEERLKETQDKTLEHQIKKSNYDKKRNLRILEDTEEEDSSSSESSDSSSSESSSDSDKEYEDVSLTEAREHVLKKLRNKMKKEYITNT